MSNFIRYIISPVSPDSLKKERRFIFVSIITLSLFGLLMVYEASSIYSFKINSDAAYFLKKQTIFLLIGISFFFLTLLIDLEFLKQHNRKMLIFTLACLVFVVLFGKKVGGSRRWISLLGFNIQPSELLKISFLLYCVDFCRRKKKLIIYNPKQGLLPLGIVVVLICFMLLLQPDLGSAVFWLIWVILILFIFGARMKHLALILLVGIVASCFLVKMYPYRFRRVTAYVNPFSDPQGAGFQLIQSQTAYGVGGFWGVGLGEGKQKLFFLPAAHTDFIFSIIAEELGFLGVFSVFLTFFILFHKMFRIADSAQDEFKKGILWGVIFIFFLEVLINIGVTCGLLPTKGLSLPFISYGGSNLVVHYILLGLFFNASRKKRISREIVN